MPEKWSYSKSIITNIKESKIIFFGPGIGFLYHYCFKLQHHQQKNSSYHFLSTDYAPSTALSVSNRVLMRSRRQSLLSLFGKWGDWVVDILICLEFLVSQSERRVCWLWAHVLNCSLGLPSLSRTSVRWSASSSDWWAPPAWGKGSR